MARKRAIRDSGTVVVLEHVSRVLEANPLGDPHVRRLAVWLPPHYDQGATGKRGRRFPVLFDLVGFEEFTYLTVLVMIALLGPGPASRGPLLVKKLEKSS